MKKVGAVLKKIVGMQLFIPLAALLILIVFNLIVDPNFFLITVKENAGGRVLSGNIISILDYGSELAILALGMTLVTAASGGQDISVGATIAIAGSALLRFVKGDCSVPNFLIGLLVCIAAGVACGAFNGVLVAQFKIPPMVATLILYTAGRSIAAWINNNESVNIPEPYFKYFGGYIPGCPIPTPVFIAIGSILLTFLLLKFTNLGLYSQSVGINANASRLNGINPKLVKIICFMFLGLCVAIVSVIRVSRTSGITYNVIAQNIEMDAILAVALGGNSLGGGKFNIWASVIGAYIIQFLTTTLYKFKVQPDELPAYKAVVVIILVVISSPFVRRFFSEMTRKAKEKNAKGVA